MSCQSHCSSDHCGGSEVMEIYFADVIEVQPVHVTTGWEERVEDTNNVVYSDAVVGGQGGEGLLDNFSINSTIALNIYILAGVIYFGGEGRKLDMLDNLVNLYLLVHGAIKLPCHWFAKSGTVQI